MIGHRDTTSLRSPPKDLLPVTSEEALVADIRAGVTPSQMVEQKLRAILKRNPALVSHTQSTNDSRPRGR
jgi:hypothetical protein